MFVWKIWLVLTYLRLKSSNCIPYRIYSNGGVYPIAENSLLKILKIINEFNNCVCLTSVTVDLLDYTIFNCIIIL